MNPPVTGGFSSQRPDSAENISIWWRHLVSRCFIEVRCMILYFRHIISIVLLWQVRKYVNGRFVRIGTLDWEHYPDGQLPPTQVATNVVSIIVWNTAGFMDFYVQYFSRSTRDQGINCQSSWANFVISELFEISLAYNINRKVSQSV